MTDVELQPWEQRDGETPGAYRAFRAFRDLGPARTLVAVEGCGAYRTIKMWAQRHRWAERVRAWDVETFRLDDARRLEAIRTMGTTHQQIGRTMISVGLQALRNVDGLTPHQAARFVDLGTRLERSALIGDGLPPLPAVPVDDGADLSPLERIARELAGTA